MNKKIVKKIDIKINSNQKKISGSIFKTNQNVSNKTKVKSGKILKGEERKVFETSKIKLNVLKSEKIIGLN